MATRYQKFIGGLLGEDVEGMSEEERKQLSRQGTTSAILGMLGGKGLLGGLGAYGEQREEKRKKAKEEEQAAIQRQLQVAIGSQLGEGQGMSPNLMNILSTPEGAAAVEANPMLKKAIEDRLGRQVVGGSIYDRATGQFIKPPEEARPKVPVREVDVGNAVIVYYNDGTTERIRKGVAPSAVAVGAVGAGGIKPTKGQEAVDKKFSDTIVDYVAEGGYADVEKQIGQLEQVIGALESGKSNITGPGIAMLAENMPNVAAGMYPEAINAKDLVEEVAQRNLRAILGAQFAQTEGAQLIKRAYNPALSEEQNAARLRSLVQQMRQANTAKRDALDYWNKYGTLAGYEGKLPPATITIGESGKKKTRKVGGFTITEEP